MTARLSGVRVVEIGALPAAAYAARLFADFGAEVIKVEPPGGDPNRSFPPARKACRRTRPISTACCAAPTC
jgi:crotonobetainyl-CoA:carnitine CoA-transferase CaiB-like acyl-CoA transferase